jgi:hypothetical protein
MNQLAELHSEEKNGNKKPTLWRAAGVTDPICELGGRADRIQPRVSSYGMTIHIVA